MIKQIFLGSAIAASFIFTGCGGGSTSTAQSESLTTGYFVDSAVSNLNYDCVADNVLNKTTASNGEFQCKNMSQVRFRINNLILGEISQLPDDGYVFPQDLVGVSREDVYDENVTAIARVLQMCDKDHNVTNGVEISDDILADFNTSETLTVDNVDNYLTRIRARNGNFDINATEAQKHLHGTVQDIDSKRVADLNISTLPISELSNDTLETINYMLNEEKLAHDLYISLYELYPNLFQLQNIAERSETKHENLVSQLADKYGVENDSNLSVGEFGLSEINGLYDTLYDLGKNSAVDALKVGCMVEVTDINDLDTDIAIAQEDGALDVLTVFTSLRDGSYNHYWAFNKALINQGIEEGCRSAGEEYYHPEYPQNTNPRSMQ